MTKAEIMKALKGMGIKFNPKATRPQLEALLLPKADDKPTVTPPPAKSVKGVVIRKIATSELIPLQMEGKLVGYNSATKMGRVKDEGSEINFPGGQADNLK